jgi:hypothetical protein
MKSRINKFAKTIAIGIFFMALFFNVKLSLEDPFVRIDNKILAQTSSSTSSNDWPVWVCCQAQSEGCVTRDGSFYMPYDRTYYGASTCP